MPVGRLRCRLRIIDQSFANEYIPRLARRYGAVVHSPLRSQREAIEGDSLKGRDEAASPYPMRLAIGLLEQVRAGRFDPQRIHRCHHARIHARRLDDTARNDPFWRP